MGPLRGDGNLVALRTAIKATVKVEKMGPLRGDGNTFTFTFLTVPSFCREDGSPSWGRKPNNRFLQLHVVVP